MPRTAKLFKNGRSQAVRLPKEFRFEGKEVAIRRDPATGAVVLSAGIEHSENLATDRQIAPPRASWEERFVVWDALDSADENALERNWTPPVQRDFF